MNTDTQILGICQSFIPNAEPKTSINNLTSEAKAHLLHNVEVTVDVEIFDWEAASVQTIQDVQHLVKAKERVFYSGIYPQGETL